MLEEIEEKSEEISEEIVEEFLRSVMDIETNKANDTTKSRNDKKKSPRDEIYEELKKYS